MKIDEHLAKLDSDDKVRTLAEELARDQLNATPGEMMHIASCILTAEAERDALRAERDEARRVAIVLCWPYRRDTPWSDDEMNAAIVKAKEWAR